jgi:hypothetical protein
MRGMAPPPDASIAVLESVADVMLGAGMKPVFLVPPPSRHFSNGLFADRYVTLAATLRRLARRDARIGLVDPSTTMAQPGAFGIEPASGLFHQDEGVLPTPAGALRLAIATAAELRKFLPDADRPHSNLTNVLNPNPGLRGNLGSVGVEGAAGDVASDFRLESHGLSAVDCRAKVLEGGGQRINLSGRYSTGWSFVRLVQSVAADTVGTIAKGDRIEAVASVSLRGDVENVAAISLTATPVWRDGYVGLHSHDYAGGAGTGLAYAAELRTPTFNIPAPLSKLHLSLSLYLRPGSELEIDAELDVSSLALRRLAP